VIRIFIFGLLGPPIGGLVFFAPDVGALVLLKPMVLLQLFSGLFYFLVGSYLFGFAPALLACQADEYLSDKLTLWPRVAAVTLVGAAVSLIYLSVILGLASFSTGMSRSPSEPNKLLLALQFIVIGAVPSGVCAYLSR